MEEKDKDYPELSDLEWIMDLAFSVDMLCHLDRLNLTLLGVQFLLQQNIPTKMMLSPSWFTDGMVFAGLMASFSQPHTPSEDKLYGR
ncbi:general transcription factor II-I repeat domain-containing protein 2B-like isoform X2 [Syngnathoides biaculeatus]|uniref:general transcription factor II-I repeat domain-containing protein 2B-like isoform X2 n=1 Tax=Syngnathoides biaculeatus TaxID=300417 RepID=UPI002ADDFE4C|nr:general transcription factor II-I repeat domain-containing protein 2B-like isoform X2 [Syngnathoides biaculeatus]